MLLLLILSPLALSGGGGNLEGVDILPMASAPPSGGPYYAATFHPDSPLYDFISGGNLPPSWKVLFGELGQITITVCPPVTDGSGGIHQPINISGTLGGYFINVAGTLAGSDGRLHVVGPDGSSLLTFFIERIPGGPLIFPAALSFDPEELGDGDDTDDIGGWIEDPTQGGGGLGLGFPSGRNVATY